MRSVDTLHRATADLLSGRDHDGGSRHIAGIRFPSQGKYAEAEQLLVSVPEAINSSTGADLLARIKFEQGDESTARHMWEKLLAIDPANESARNALAAIDSPIDLSAMENVEACLCRRFKYACAVVIVSLLGFAFIIGTICGGKGQVEATQEADKIGVVAEQSIPVRAINGALLRSLKDGILTNMNNNTILVLRGGKGKYITDRQKRLSIIAECFERESKVPLSKILFQASDQESDAITLSVRQYNYE